MLRQGATTSRFGTYVSAQLDTLSSSALPGHASAYTTRSVCAAPLPRKDRGAATVRQRGLLPAAPPAPALAQGGGESPKVHDRIRSHRYCWCVRRRYSAPRRLAWR